MRSTSRFSVGLILGLIALAGGWTAAKQAAPQAAQQDPAAAAAAARALAEYTDIKALVDRLELEKYKATIKGLTQFGDRRQATKRNRDAVNWIDEQLKSYGYTNTARIVYDPPVPTRECGPSVPASVVVAPAARAGGAGAAGGAAGTGGAGGAGGAGGGRGTGGGGRGAANAGRGLATGEGGSRIIGNRGRTGVNCDPMAQPDERIRALNSGPVIPGPVDEVYATKIGTKYPNEMYIVGAHMDGHGYNEAVNDDGSGTALVMELARIFADPNVETERSIRFALWNGEEGGLNGARAYVAQRQALQGKEDPVGSGKYPEPTWLGMIQHDMMMWDHGMPVPKLGADGKPEVDANGRGVFIVRPEQRLEADFNIEFQSTAKFAEGAMKLAFVFKAAADKYATDYPGTVGPHMTNTDSGPFMDLIPAISLRENERGTHTGAGWNPTWHTPLDVWTTFTDKDFKLGLNAAQTTLAAIAQLTGMKIKK